MCGKWSRAINSQGVQCYSLYVGLKKQVRQSQAYASSVFCLRPSHWWRNTRSSKTTSLCRTPSGWLKMTVSRRLKRVSFYITSRISLLLLVSQWERTYVTVSSAMHLLVFTYGSNKARPAPKTEMSHYFLEILYIHCKTWSSLLKHSRTELGCLLTEWHASMPLITSTTSSSDDDYQL